MAFLWINPFLVVDRRAFCRSQVVGLSWLGEDIAFDKDRLDRLIDSIAVDCHRLVDTADTVGVVLNADFAFTAGRYCVCAPLGNRATAASFCTGDQKIR